LLSISRIIAALDPGIAVGVGFVCAGGAFPPQAAIVSVSRSARRLPRAFFNE